MLEKLNGQYLLVVGISGCRVRDPEKSLRSLREGFPSAQVQLLRADRIAGKEHLLLAAKKAVRLFEQKKNRSHTLAMELLLLASAQHQISRAIETLGVTGRTKSVVVAALTPDDEAYVNLTNSALAEFGGISDESVIELTPRKMFRLKKVYGIERREIEAARLYGEGEDSVLKRLIIERSAISALRS